jgi:hypothetical protein
LAEDRSRVEADQESIDRTVDLIDGKVRVRMLNGFVSGGRLGMALSRLKEIAITDRRHQKVAGD